MFFFSQIGNDAEELLNDDLFHPLSGFGVRLSSDVSNQFVGTAFKYISSDFSSGITNHSPALPEGWIERSDAQGRFYFEDTRTGETTWTRPSIFPQDSATLACTNEDQSRGVSVTATKRELLSVCAWSPLPNSFPKLFNDATGSITWQPWYTFRFESYLSGKSRTFTLPLLPLRKRREVSVIPNTSLQLYLNGEESSLQLRQTMMTPINNGSGDFTIGLAFEFPGKIFFQNHNDLEAGVVGVQDVDRNDETAWSIQDCISWGLQIRPGDLFSESTTFSLKSIGKKPGSVRAAMATTLGENGSLGAMCDFNSFEVLKASYLDTIQKKIGIAARLNVCNVLSRYLELKCDDGDHSAEGPVLHIKAQVDGSFAVRLSGSLLQGFATANIVAACSNIFSKGNWQIGVTVNMI